MQLLSYTTVLTGKSTELFKKKIEHNKQNSSSKFGYQVNMDKPPTGRKKDRHMNNGQPSSVMSDAP